MYIISGADFLFVPGILAINTHYIKSTGSDHLIKLLAESFNDSFSRREM